MIDTHGQSAQRRARRRFALPLACVLFAGCAPPEKRPPALDRVDTQQTEALLEDGINADTMSAQISQLLLVTYGRMIGDVTALAARSDDPAIRETILRWKIRFADNITAIQRIPDPRKQFLLLWIMLEEAGYRMRSGDVVQAMGDEAVVLDRNRSEVLAHLMKIGREHFDPAQLDAATPEIEALGREQAVGAALSGDRLALPEIDDGDDETNAVDGLLSAAMSPISGLQGVGDTPQAIAGASLVVADFKDVIEALPERSRWQVELMLYEIQSLEMMIELRQNLERITDSFESIAQTTERLPDDVREQWQEALGSTEQSMQQLQVTLDKADGTVDGINTALATAQRIVTDIETATVGLTETAEAFTGTANAATALAETVAELKGPPPPPDAEPSEPVFEMQDLVHLADQLATSTDNLRLMITDIQASGFGAAMDQLDAESRSTIDYASGAADDLVDRLTIRGLILIGTLLIGLVLYRVVTAKLLRNAA